MSFGEWDAGPTLHASMPDTRIKQPDGVAAPSLGEWAGAAWRQDSPIGSLFESQTGGLDPWEIDDANFNTLEYVRERYGDAFEAEHGERFLDVFNRRYADALKSQIDMETEDRKTLAAAGTAGMIGEFAFSVFTDPTNLLPGGAIVKSVKAGKAALGSALRMGVAGGVATAVSEGVLQATQELRTPQESALAIGGSAVLATVMGGTTGVIVSRVERRS